MDIRFDGRVVLVSGAAHGIGRAIGRAFMEAGARVHLADISDEVRQVATEIGATAHVLDLSDRAASTALVQGIADQEDRLDILALAAGGVCREADLPLADVTEASWNRVFGANVESALWLSQAAAPFMQRAGWGRIVIISSGAGLRPSLTGLHGRWCMEVEEAEVSTFPAWDQARRTDTGLAMRIIRLSTDTAMATSLC